MPNIETYENLVLGSGGAGKFIAWTMAGAGRRTALVECKALGGACPNVACLPSKNIIYSAKVAALAKRGAEFGLRTEALSVDMKTVQRRKRLMVEGLHQMHVDRTKASGAELIMGNARFVAPRTVEIDLNNGGKRTILGDRVFLDLGSRAAMPGVPGLAEANPMTHVELLDLDRLPAHLIVLGGGYVGLELAQAMRRLGSQVTVIEAGPQLAGREDPDISTAGLVSRRRNRGLTRMRGSPSRGTLRRRGASPRQGCAGTTYSRSYRPFGSDGSQGEHGRARP
jgi:pyruvate/2-oxoglutarate dehydrogenase complex dihydrolipoamide dehydrogenase (E3) component